jgi:hypothetical protein
MWFFTCMLEYKVVENNVVYTIKVLFEPYSLS